MAKLTKYKPHSVLCVTFVTAKNKALQKTHI